MPRAGVTVLQLDTGFPRLPGDVACPDSYAVPLEILRVPRATVGRIVTGRPADIDLGPFRAALDRATGRIVTTSCGFLSPFQQTLAARTAAPFVASSLIALPGLVARYGAGRVAVVTFDADALTPAHLHGVAAPDVTIIGLGPDDHLRRVIANDLPNLDAARAQNELLRRLERTLPARTSALLLECTNLPPCAPALRRHLGLPVHDILTVIETTRPGTVAPIFLPGAADAA